MKILFDARYIRTDFHDGISRYSASLGAALAEIAPVTFLIHDDRQRESLPPGASVILIHPPTSVKEPFSAYILNKLKPDVVFSPMQTIGTFGRKYRQILTLHDMIYYRHRTPPRDLPGPIRLGWRLFHLSYLPQRITLNTADVVATVSETSKQDFERVRLTRRPIIVVPNAPQRENYVSGASPESPESPELPQSPQQDSARADISRAPRNLVYMGSFMPYKNVETLVRGMAELPEHTLHLLSRIRAERQAELMQLVAPRASVIFYNGVTDDEYRKILLDNAVLVTASRDEGYGLPLAEALELGVPAVVSNLQIFREVAAGGALYFSVDNFREFAARVVELDNIALRKPLVSAGVEQIKTFSWPKSAQILYSAMQELCSPAEQ